MGLDDALYLCRPPATTSCVYCFPRKACPFLSLLSQTRSYSNQCIAASISPSWQFTS